MPLRLTARQKRFREDATLMWALAEHILASGPECNHVYKQVLSGARMEQMPKPGPRYVARVLNQLLNRTSDSDLGRLINYYLGQQKGTR